MKIAHIITSINRGGAENQLSQMIIEQQQYQKDITLIFLKGNGYWKYYLEKNNISCLGPFFPKGNYLSIKCLYNLIKTILENKYQILHLHMPPALFVIFLLRKFFRRYSPLIIYTAHNDEPFFRNMFLDKILTFRMLSVVDKIISITKTVKTFLIENYRISSRKILIIQYGFKKEFYNFRKTNKKELSYINKKYIYIGTVARLVSQKRIDLLIDSFSRIDHEYINNFKLVIIGDGVLKKELIDFSKNKKVFKNIIWIKYTEDVISHIKKWDLFCLTSQYEGFGLVLLEAISAGTPILAMRSSSIKEIIGPCGETVKFGDVNSFSKNITKIIKNKKIYFNKNYIKKYSFKENIILHNKIYSNLLKTKNKHN